MKRKRIISFLLILFIMIGIPSVNVQAANNNSVASAVTINDNVEHTDITSDTSKYYYYKWKAKKSGYVYFGIERKDYLSTSNPSWKAKVYDSKMNQVDDISYGSNSYTTYYITVNAGDEYYIELWGCDESCSDIAFSITAHFTQYSYVEKSNNDSASNASKLVVGKTNIGEIFPSNDADFYKLTAPKDGYMIITAGRYKFESTKSYEWKYEIYDSNMNLIASLNRGNDKFTINYPLAKGKSIYIKVTASKSTGQLYYIKPVFKAKKYIEKENNDIFNKANKIKFNTSYTGSLNGAGADWYYLKMPSTGYFKVKYSLKNSLNYAQQVVIYNSNQKEIANTGKIYKNGSASFYATKGEKIYLKVSHAEDNWILYGGRTVGVLHQIKVYK